MTFYKQTFFLLSSILSRRVTLRWQLSLWTIIKILIFLNIILIGVVDCVIKYSVFNNHFEPNVFSIKYMEPVLPCKPVKQNYFVFKMFSWKFHYSRLYSLSILKRFKGVPFANWQTWLMYVYILFHMYHVATW